MNLYFAPMEGITGCVYRSTHREVFGGCSAYFAPFITPSDNEKVSKKGLKDVLFENNKGFPLKVQVLTNQSEAFIKFARKIKAYGYDEINLNLGCPSATVVGKGRGAGMLAEPYKLDKFLYEIFSESDIKISVKTRIGYEDKSEIEDLMNIYNKYQISQLIVHPRTRIEFYKGIADKDAFKYAYNVSKNKVCYNGDVCSKEDFEEIKNQFPDAEGVMIGRGAIGNPFIFEEIIALSEGIEYRRPSLEERAEAALYQLSAAVADKGEAVAVRESRKQIALYLHSFRGAAELRRRINSAESYEDVQGALYAALSEAKIQGG